MNWADVKLKVYDLADIRDRALIEVTLLDLETGRTWSRMSLANMNLASRWTVLRESNVEQHCRV